VAFFAALGLVFLIAASKNMAEILDSGKQPTIVINAMSTSETKLKRTEEIVSKSYSLEGKYNSTV
jgi:hypothetical protein